MVLISIILHSPTDIKCEHIFCESIIAYLLDLLDLLHLL